jgi:hypothetical protein
MYDEFCHMFTNIKLFLNFINIIWKGRWKNAEAETQKNQAAAQDSPLPAGQKFLQVAVSERTLHWGRLTSLAVFSVSIHIHNPAILS